MDARVKLATTDGERWAYVADALKETSEQNRETAVILARLTEQLNEHSDQIQELKAGQQRAMERALDRAGTSDAPDLDAPAAPSPMTVAGVLNRIYNDARLVFVVGGFGGGILVALINHVGLSWH